MGILTRNSLSNWLILPLYDASVDWRGKKGPQPAMVGELRGALWRGLKENFTVPPLL